MTSIMMLVYYSVGFKSMHQGLPLLLAPSQTTTMFKFATRTFALSRTQLVPNSKFPVIIYQGAFPQDVTAKSIEDQFSKNKWTPQWRYGMYHQSHYHSTTHEALGVFKGSARLRFGVSDKEPSEGPNSVETDVGTGDIIVVPSGVAHRCVEEHDGFEMVGAYPEGAKQWDMNYGGEDKGVDDSIPELDPYLGSDEQGLTSLWLAKK